MDQFQPEFEVFGRLFKSVLCGVLFPRYLSQRCVPNGHSLFDHLVLHNENLAGMEGLSHTMKQFHKSIIDAGDDDDRVRALARLALVATTTVDAKTLIDAVADGDVDAISDANILVSAVQLALTDDRADDSEIALLARDMIGGRKTTRANIVKVMRKYKEEKTAVGDGAMTPLARLLRACLLKCDERLRVRWDRNTKKLIEWEIHYCVCCYNFATCQRYCSFDAITYIDTYETPSGDKICDTCTSLRYFGILK